MAGWRRQHVDRVMKPNTAGTGKLPCLEIVVANVAYKRGFIKSQTSHDGLYGGFIGKGSGASFGGAVAASPIHEHLCVQGAAPEVVLAAEK